MDFDFSDDQEQLRDAVRKWVDKGYDFERRRAIVKAGGFDRGAYNELAELGLAGLYISEADGGLGMGPVEGMVVMEELGRGIVLEPLAQTLIAGGVIGGYAGADVKAAWLPKIASGEALVVLAQQERGARYRLDDCKTTAAQAGSGWTVSGAKSVVPAGDQADAFIVPAAANGQIALFLVERNAAGVSTQGYGTQDGGRAAEVSLKNAPASLITTDGLAALEHAVDIGIANVCAEAVGVVDALMVHTAEHLRTRKQFGAPLAKFQVMQHRMADMAIALEQLKSMACAAAMAVDAGEPAQRRRLVSAAKVLVSQLGRQLGLSAIQMHGAMGMTDECRVSHFAKRLIVIGQLFGDASWHLKRV